MNNASRWRLLALREAMKSLLVIIPVTTMLLCAGCESVKWVNSDARYFGGFSKGAPYVTRVETIITPDKRIALYGEMMFPPKRLFLVPAGTGAATNYVRGKFSGLKRADPVKEVGRLPVGTRLEFIGIETVVVPFEPPRPALPFALVIDGPLQGTKVCLYHLCADRFVWGWPQTQGTRSDLDKGREVEVFSPSAKFLVTEAEP